MITFAQAVQVLEAKIAKPLKHPLKVGDILYASWGYNQTNIDFYEVTRLMKRMVEIREIASKLDHAERGADYLVPVPGKFIGRKLRKLPDSKGTVRITSYAWAYLWDGKPKYQTATGWGH